MKIEHVLLFLVFGLCCVISYTDIKKGVIKNSHILVFAVLALILDAFLYASLSSAEIRLFLTNFLIVMLLSILLYKKGIWGAGDSKFCIVLSLLYPADYYHRTFGLSYAPFIYVLILAFSLSFLFLVAESFYLTLCGYDGINKNKALVSVKDVWLLAVYFMMFFSLDYLLCIGLSMLGLPLKQEVLLLINILFVLVIPRKIINHSYTWYLILFIFLVILFLNVRRNMGYVNPFYIVISLLVLLFRQNSWKYAYQKIRAEELKSGMILSRISLTAMTQSRIKGLPNNISEDMTARLSQEEVNKSLQWSKSSKGQNYFIIVKKMHFGLIISISMFIFMALELVRY